MHQGTIGVGIAGFWHVHAHDYARDATQHPATQVVALWDPEEQNREDAHRKLSVPAYDDLDAFLARPEVQGITVTTATNEHTEVISRALKAGVHVFTEKLLAPTVDECEALIALARENNVALAVSLPRLSEPVVRTTRSLIDRGALGDVTYARVRLAHDGWIANWLPDRFADPVAAIGGAFADLGCHPAYVIQHVLGPQPASVSAEYGRMTGREVEDNAVVTARYDSGAIGVAEASFVTTPGAFALEVRGTTASLLYGYGRDELIAKGGEFGDEWVSLELERPAPSPFDNWVSAIYGDADTTANLTAATNLTRFIVAANTAAEQKGTAR
ncbi:Gfo/Idh/MocA family protein [Microbacterium sp. YY-01]|uniref:Gfo/Idh/MocA family protein n=1 Tax=Microbacterium sp. YY-01 TaxID=3421634 RepID=UPI003D164BD9